MSQRNSVVGDQSSTRYGMKGKALFDGGKTPI